MWSGFVVDNGQHYGRMREMISKISKRSADKVKLYSDHQAGVRSL